MQLAKMAYSNTAKTVRHDRDFEYDAFIKVTRELSLSAKNKENDHPRYIKALSENRRLWTVLARDVSGDANQLPKQLRAQIVYLFKFTLIHTSKIVNKMADETALIEINTAIMRGLNSGGEK